MKIVATRIAGVFLVETVAHHDERGSFARTFCAETFRHHGLDPRVSQCSVSFNRHEGTLRGLHFQAPPHAEAKLVGCLQGRLYDVVLDVRSGSATFGQWLAFDLRANDGRFVYVPEGVAHGFQTLHEQTLVSYQISAPYSPDHGRGIRWNDPAFAVHWPCSQPIISARDRAFPDFTERAFHVADRHHRVDS